MWRPVHIGDKKYPSHFIQESYFYHVKVEPVIKKLICVEIYHFYLLFYTKNCGDMLISEFVFFCVGVCP